METAPSPTNGHAAFTASLAAEASNGAKQRTKGFHRRYVEICKKRNAARAPEIKEKDKNVLDFYADRIKLDDWSSIMKALMEDDGSLRILAVRSRKNFTHVLEKVDNEKKCRALRSDVPMCTNFIFNPMMEIVARVVRSNRSISTLVLEGLPMANKYTQCLTKALLQNTSLRSISLARSNLSDEGCEMLCATIKHLPNVEHINFSGCYLTVKGAESVSNLLKYQKILRFSEAWNLSLRYRDVDADKIPGLKYVCLNNNPEIGDDGLQFILSVMKEDEWIKSLEMQNCGITDVGGRAIAKCLDFNKSLVVFDVRHNEMISNATINVIRKKFDMEPEVDESLSNQKLSSKIKAVQSRERIAYLEQQLEIEIQNRKHAESLNEQLHAQMLDYQREITQIQQCNSTASIPDDCSLVPKDQLQNLILEVQELRQNSSAQSRSSNTLSEKSNVCLTAINIVRKAKSELIQSNLEENWAKMSKSDSKMRSQNTSARQQLDSQTPRPAFMETNIGDYFNVRQEPQPIMVNNDGCGDQLVSAEKSTHNQRAVNFTKPSAFFKSPIRDEVMSEEDEDGEDEEWDSTVYDVSK